jgi:hypothetical protein
MYNRNSENNENSKIVIGIIILIWIIIFLGTIKSCRRSSDNSNDLYDLNTKLDSIENRLNIIDHKIDMVSNKLSTEDSLRNSETNRKIKG